MRDVARPQLAGMARATAADEATHPLDIGLFRARAVMTGPNRGAQLSQQGRRRYSHRGSIAIGKSGRDIKKTPYGGVYGTLTFTCTVAYCGKLMTVVSRNVAPTVTRIHAVKVAARLGISTR